MGQALLTEASLKPKPIYSDFLKQFAREDLQFAQNVEKKFEALVSECKLATTKSGKKAHNLPVMKQAERRFVHELAPYYGIETQSFDTEPYRNVCLYASKEKTCLPSLALTQSIEVARAKAPAMPKLRQLNPRLESGIQSQLKVLSPLEGAATAASASDNIPVSSAFAVLGDEFDDDKPTINKPPQPQPTTNKPPTTNNAIDYFDLTD